LVTELHMKGAQSSNWPAEHTPWPSHKPGRVWIEDPAGQVSAEQLTPLE
jgi:hypothetical protein